MEIVDGLFHYKNVNEEYFNLALDLEDRAKQILEFLTIYGDLPTAAELKESKEFLMGVERWKAGCLNQRIGNAVSNSERAIWQAFQMARQAPNDIDSILAIMRLKGFGSSEDEETGQRRAKLATSVLRFFWPDRWGVVDWRNAAMLGMLKKSDCVIDDALAKARKISCEELRDLYDIIDEQAACYYNQEYREISREYPNELPRAADVDMALFGLSLMAWK